MTNGEMKHWFGIVYNNITSNKAPGVNDYELGHYLTSSQEQILKEFYESVRGFETTEYATEALQPFVCVKSYSKSDGQKDVDAPVLTYTFDRPVTTLDGTSLLAPMFFAVYEEVLMSKDDCETPTRYLVVPTTHNEFFSVINNPFRGHLGNRALRIELGNKIELILPSEIKDTDSFTYNLRYIRKPKPIVLAASSDYTVDNETSGALDRTDCELPEFLHRTVVNRAAALAKASWEA